MAIESDSFLVCKTLPKHKFVLGNQYVSRVICKVTEKSNVPKGSEKGEIKILHGRIFLGPGPAGI